MLPEARKLFKNKFWTFQQDSAPAHAAKSVVRFLTENVPDLISPQEWPPSSPDLNPLDYSIWAILEKRACRKLHRNLATLKASLRREWARLDLETIENAINSWPERLKKCAALKGERFE